MEPSSYIKKVLKTVRSFSLLQSLCVANSMALDAIIPALFSIVRIFPFVSYYNAENVRDENVVGRKFPARHPSVWIISRLHVWKFDFDAFTKLKRKKIEKLTRKFFLSEKTLNSGHFKRNIWKNQVCEFTDMLLSVIHVTLFSNIILDFLEIIFT